MVGMVAGMAVAGTAAMVALVGMAAMVAKGEMVMGQ